MFWDMIVNKSNGLQGQSLITFIMLTLYFTSGRLKKAMVGGGIPAHCILVNNFQYPPRMRLYF